MSCRHNKVRGLIGDQCLISWGSVVKETIISSEDKSCLRGYLAVRGKWRLRERLCLMFVSLTLKEEEKK